MKKLSRLAALLSMLLTVSLILSACGGETTTPAANTANQPSAAQSATVTIEEQDNKFSSNEITTNVGNTLLFVNKGTHAHTATAGNGSWDSGNLDPGASFSHTFSTAGVFIVYCKYHGSADGKGMATTITVIQGATPTP